MHFSCGAVLKARGMNIPYTVYGHEPAASARSETDSVASDAAQPKLVTSSSSLQPSSFALQSRSLARRRRPTSHDEGVMEDCLSSSVVDLGADHTQGLRSLAWVGVPPHLRGGVWRLLCEVLPPTVARREEEHARRVAQYVAFVAWYGDDKSGEGAEIEKQLALDLPRHKMLLYHIPECVNALKRVLFVWCLRHPGVGYVQGMDDIAANFFCAYLAEAVEEVLSRQKYQDMGSEVGCTVFEDELLPLRVATAPVAGEDQFLRQLLWTSGGGLTEGLLERVEADTYWSAGKVLGWTQDHFVNGLEGVHAVGLRVTELLEAADPDLHGYLQGSGVMISQATFQWHHCLLCRELPPPHAMRLWDTYLAIGAGFAEFHCYVSLAIIIYLKPLLLPREGGGGPTLDVLMDVLKSPCRLAGPREDPRVLVVPPVRWVDERISEAFVQQERLREVTLQVAP